MAEDIKKAKKEEKEGVKNDAEKNKIWAIVAYILFFVPLLTEAKNSPFVKFHVKQSLLLVLISLVVAIIGRSFIYISFSFWAFLSPVMFLLNLAIIVFWIMGLISAINGETKELPIIGKYAQSWFKF